MSEINIQTEHNVKKSQPVGGKPVGLGFENGATVKQIQVVWAGREPGTSGLRVRRPNQEATSRLVVMLVSSVEVEIFLICAFFELVLHLLSCASETETK